MNTPQAQDRSFHKVLGIGLSRTGTTSLDAALWHLGLTSEHNPYPARAVAGDFGFMDELDGATDISIAHAFGTLDGLYPGSKFVLTVRDAEPWLRSVVHHFDRIPAYLDEGPSGDLRRATYGEARPTPERFLTAYREHLVRVASHFAGRPDDLLVLDVTKGQGFASLCPFLGLPDPGIDFPRANRAGDSASTRSAYPAHKPQKKLSRRDLAALFGQASR